MIKPTIDTINRHRRKIVTIGFIVSLIGFLLAVLATSFETDTHNKYKQQKIDANQYINKVYDASVASSSAEMCIFLGFIMMNIVIIHSLVKTGHL